MKLDNKGFTVIELILSFILVMFLALGLFALVNNYKNRQQTESTKRDLLAFQNKLTQDIYEDILERKLDYMRYCTDGSGQTITQCVNIRFSDGKEKQLKVVTERKTTTEDGTTFEYDTFNIIYGGVKYENPEPKFAKVVNDYILTLTLPEDNLEYGVIYRLKIRIEHQDIDDEYVIDVVATGTSI